MKVSCCLLPYIIIDEPLRNTREKFTVCGCNKLMRFISLIWYNKQHREPVQWWYTPIYQKSIKKGNHNTAILPSIKKRLLSILRVLKKKLKIMKENEKKSKVAGNGWLWCWCCCPGVMPRRHGDENNRNMKRMQATSVFTCFVLYFFVLLFVTPVLYYINLFFVSFCFLFPIASLIPLFTLFCLLFIFSFFLYFSFLLFFCFFFSFCIPFHCTFFFLSASPAIPFPLPFVFFLSFL